VAISADPRPTAMEILPPYRILAKISRPILSVPRMCFADGACKMLLKSILAEDWDVIRGAAKQIKKITIKIIRPAMESLLASIFLNTLLFNRFFGLPDSS